MENKLLLLFDLLKHLIKTFKNKDYEQYYDVEEKADNELLDQCVLLFLNWFSRATENMITYHIDKAGTHTKYNFLECYYQINKLTYEYCSYNGMEAAKYIVDMIEDNYGGRGFLDYHIIESECNFENPNDMENYRALNQLYAFEKEIEEKNSNSSEEESTENMSSDDEEEAPPKNFRNFICCKECAGFDPLRKKCLYCGNRRTNIYAMPIDVNLKVKQRNVKQKCMRCDEWFTDKCKCTTPCWRINYDWDYSINPDYCIACGKKELYTQLFCEDCVKFDDDMDHGHTNCCRTCSKGFSSDEMRNFHCVNCTNILLSNYENGIKDFKIIKVILKITELFDDRKKFRDRLPLDEALVKYHLDYYKKYKYAITKYFSFEKNKNIYEIYMESIKPTNLSVQDIKRLTTDFRFDYWSTVICFYKQYMLEDSDYTEFYNEEDISVGCWPDELEYDNTIEKLKCKLKCPCTKVFHNALPFTEIREVKDDSEIVDVIEGAHLVDSNFSVFDMYFKYK